VNDRYCQTRESQNPAAGELWKKISRRWQESSGHFPP
jgi:hypothetical protein